MVKEIHLHRRLYRFRFVPVKRLGFKKRRSYRDRLNIMHNRCLLLIQFSLDMEKIKEAAAHLFYTIFYAIGCSAIQSSITYVLKAKGYF